MERLKAFLQLGILMISVFAISYNLDKSSVLFETISEKIKEPIFPLVSAEEDLAWQCCEQTNEGGICQNVITEQDCQKDARLIPSKCEATSFCKPGCCIDDVEGTYDKNVPQALCNGRWVDDKNCNIDEAKFGCCILGERTSFVTETRCERLADLNGLDKDFQDMNEAQCLATSMIDVRGACVFESGNETGCEMMSPEECFSLTGKQSSFKEGYLCTADELNTVCEKTEKTTCVEGKDEVYYLDSCGNAANIYDASKFNSQNYWDMVVSKEESCNPQEGNANSEICGNCNRFLGGICDSSAMSDVNPRYGDYYCKDTSCEWDGENYKNGESWCVYDGKIGDGDDVVGSRHFKYVCQQGEVIVEPCADYRNEICVQTNTFDVEVEGENQEIDFRNAACRVNNARECIDLNTKQEDLEECTERLDCDVKKIALGDSFTFDVCIGKYPQGFGFDERYQKTAEQVCRIATRTCTVIYEADSSGDCECVENCACEDAVFTEEMNNLCRALGDCGLEANIAGKTTDNYKVSEAPRLGDSYIKEIASLAKEVKGQFAEPGNVSKYLEAAGLLNSPANPGEADDPEGSSLGLYAGLGMAGIGYSVGAIAAYTSGAFHMAGGGIAWSELFGAAAGFNGFASAAIGAGIGMVAGHFLAKMLDLSPTGSMLMTLGGGLVGGALGYAIMTESLGSLLSFGVLGALFWIGVILIIASLFFGMGDCDPVEVTFTCEPWQPPTGGSDCSKCGEDGKPCSEYRCKSLGAACDLLNKGTDEEICIDENPNDATPPVVGPQLGTIGDGQKYEDVKDNEMRITNLEGGCLDAYEQLVFGISTDEPAQCRFDLEEKSYEEMQFTLGSNSYTYNHTTPFILPDPSHGQSQGEGWSGDLTMFVKCQDTHGHVTPNYFEINMCVNEGDDVSSPRVRSVEPENGGLINYESEEQEISVYTNEPSVCRYSSEDKSFEMMENTMSCDNELTQMTAFGYKCGSTVATPNAENVYYIKCQDQPWLAVQERNTNVESTMYVLNKPEKQLTIDWIQPAEDVEVASVPALVVLKVKTSGGGRSDWTGCSYSFTGENFIPFFNTYSETHEQEFNLQQGRYDIFVRCEDETGAIAESFAEFKVIKDSASPVIARAYLEGRQMNIITTEESECVYSTDLGKTCRYDFDNATSIGSGLNHVFTASKDETYYVKCKDERGNEPSACSIILKGLL